MMGRKPRLLGFAMQGVATQKRVVFLFLQTSRSVRALFVTRGHVTGGGHALSFCFGAFESDDVLGHGEIDRVVSIR